MQGDPVMKDGAVGRWLTLIGLGEDGPEGLGERARAALTEASVVFGGARHFELVGDHVKGERHVWKSPFSLSVEDIVALRGTPVVVLASGDPFLYGVGVTLSRRIDTAEILSLPHPSSFSLAASRLGWALQSTMCLSLHGRPDDLIRRHLHPCTRILALTSDGKGPAELAALLTALGFGRSEFICLEALGGREERIIRTTAREFPPAPRHALNICAIEVLVDEQSETGQKPRIIPFGFGLEDALFETDGQLTKREVRAITLSSLAPCRGERLLDIGGGSGSISIEWMLADPSMRATVIEQDPVRAERIRRNASSFGVPDLVVIEGQAPTALAGLGPFDAVFVGGGGSEPGVMEAAIAAVRPGGRVVANGVTLEMEQALLALKSRLGGQLTRIDIARAGTVGTMNAFRPAMPVTHWSWVKPSGDSKE